MKELRRQSVKRGINVNGVEQPLPDAHFVEAVDDVGKVYQASFEGAAPTDDDVIAAVLQQNGVLEPRILRSTTVAERVAGLVELCVAWNALDAAATRANSDPDFTAQERNRVAAARDLVKAKVKAYV